MEYAERGGQPERAKELRIAREQAIRGATDEMQSFSWTQTITAEEMDEFLERIIDKESWEQTLFNIALRFLPSKKALRRTTESMAEHSPLMAAIGMEVIADDHVAAQIGSVDEDQEGHLFRHATTFRQEDTRYLMRALQSAVDTHKLSPGEITAFVFRTKLFPDFPLLMEGIEAWMEEDYTKALFVLVPQVESAFRELARRLPEAVTKAKRGSKGAEVSVNLGDLLSMESIKAEIGEDVHFYIKSLYADGRGMNLRNLVAHGLAGIEYASWQTCDSIIHSFLVIGVYKDLASAMVRLNAMAEAKSSTDAGAVSDDDNEPWDGADADAPHAKPKRSPLRRGRFRDRDDGA